MTVTRRSFLRSGAATVLLTGLALDSVPLAFAQRSQKFDPSQDFLPSFEAKQEPTFNFRRETFQPYLNGVFTLSAGANSVEATLVGINQYPPTPKSSRVTRRWRPTHCFAIVFLAEGKLTDLTDIYDVEHAGLGRFQLFMTRRDGPRPGTYFYEAVFNHTL